MAGFSFGFKLVTCNEDQASVKELKSSHHNGHLYIYIHRERERERETNMVSLIS